MSKQKFLGVAVLVLVLVGFISVACTGDAPGTSPGASQAACQAASSGASLYATQCAGCHGVAGKGGSAVGIGTDAYLSKRNDAAITLVIRDGVTNSLMRAYGQSRGGRLTDAEISEIVSYLRSLSLTRSGSTR